MAVTSFCPISSDRRTVCRLPVFARLLTLFILLPLADLVLIIMLLKLHWGLTLLWVLLSGAIGVWYVRRQGTWVIRQLHDSMSENRLPTDMLIEGALVVVAGALLITPGLISDLIGFSILFRPCRTWYRKRFVAWIKNRVHFQTFQMGQTSDTEILDATVVRSKTDNSNTDGSDGNPFRRVESNQSHKE
jgi:UPF0716 protein FxsA